MFRPLVTARLRSALQTTLSAHIRNALDGVDALVWDTVARAEVFQDAGLQRGPALATAWWSEFGRLRRTQGGLFSGLHMTGTGVTYTSGSAGVALGAEPQVLGSEKQGPKGKLAQPLGERAGDAGVNVDVDIAGQVGDGIKAGLRKVRTFEESIAEKEEEEKKKSGWESSAFDL